MGKDGLSCFTMSNNLGIFKTMTTRHHHHHHISFQNRNEQDELNTFSSVPHTFNKHLVRKRGYKDDENIAPPYGGARFEEEIVSIA